MKFINDSKMFTVEGECHVTVIDIIDNVVIDTYNTKFKPNKLGEYISILVYCNSTDVIRRFVNGYVNDDLDLLIVQTLSDTFTVSWRDKSINDLSAKYLHKDDNLVGFEICVKASLLYGDDVM